MNTDPGRQDGDFDGPDNITVSPYGGVILAEDGEGIQHLVGATERGKTYPIARNDCTTRAESSSPARPSARTARSCSPTSRSPGYMFAITGPWRAQR